MAVSSEKVIGIDPVSDEQAVLNSRNRRLIAGVPQRYLSKTFRNYQADSPKQQAAANKVKKYAKDFDQVLKTGRSLMLLGSVGTGKTHLACAIAQMVIEKGLTARYMTVMGAVRRVRESWGKGSNETERQAINAMAQVDLLVLDEVGQQYGTESEKVLIYDIINARYDRESPTVIISNLQVDGVTEYLGERVIDRLRENGGTAVVFDWDSYRKTTGSSR